jgi:hypothetical protein
MSATLEGEAEAGLLNEKQLSNQDIREQRMLLSLASPALLMIVAIILIPVGWLFYLSFVGSDGQFSLEHYYKMVQYKSYARVFVTTFQVSLLTTLLCILIGYPLAYFLAMLPQRMAGFFMLAVLLPFWTSLLVRTYAWLVLLQKKGILNDFAISVGLWDEPVKLVHNLTGTLIGMAHIMLPFLVLPVFLEDLFSVVAIRHGRRFIDCFCALPRILCHPGGARRWTRCDGVHPDYGNSRKPVQLGRSECARCGAASSDNRHSLPCGTLS